MNVSRRAAMRPLAAVVLAIVAMVAAGCTSTSSAGSYEEPLVKEPIEGTDLIRLVLTPRAVERLAIESVAVERRQERLVVPAGSVLVDANGDYWVYTRPEALAFVRQEVALDRFEGADALLTDGPEAGTQVVTLGAAELFGAEFGIGK